MASDRRTNHGARPARAGSRPGPAPRSRHAIFDDPVARTASIPLALWVCAAVVAHYVGGVGTMKAAEVVHDRDELKAAVRSVRESLHPADTTFFDIITDPTEVAPLPKMEPPKEDGPDPKADGEPDPSAVTEVDKTRPLPTPKQDEPKAKPPEKEPPKVAEKEPPKEEPKPIPAVPVPAAPAAPPPPPPEDHRIAVRQHAEKDQPDNPTASRIADDANHVEHETVAKNRSHDQDAKDPSFGASASRDKDPGSGDKEDKVAQSEDRKGNQDHAPGENDAKATDGHHEAPQPQVQPTPGGKAPSPSVPGGKGGLGNAPAVPSPPSSPGGAGPASPDSMSSDHGTYTLDPANPGGDGASKRPGKKRNPSMWQTPVHVGALGLGGTGLPGGPKLNLDMKGVEQAVGDQQLRAERAADGAARRTQHRGGWEKNKFSKWKAAIENYEPAVELGNTTALNAARSPFATYLNTIHNRIHPIFAEEFLAALDSLPKGSAMASIENITWLEIVLDKDTGKVVRMGVTRGSGVTAFDIAALNSVDRAGPFGKAPDIIASPDGRVYFHWEFHRDPVDACSTRNARPYILKNPPPAGKTPAPPAKKPGAATDERTPGPLIPLRER